MLKKLIIALSTITLLNVAYAWTPDQPIKVIAPFAPGAANELAFRAVSKNVTANTRASFIIENRPGVDGVIAWNNFSEQPADGHTISIQTAESILVVLPITNGQQLASNPNSAVPVSVIASAPFAFVVRSESPIKSVQDLVQAYRGQSGPLNVGLSGATNLLAHSLMMDRVKGNTKLVQGINYKSGPQAMTDVVSGVVDVAIVPASTTRALAEAGKVRVIAFTSNTPVKQAPAVPLLKNTVPGMVINVTWEIFLPKGTPADVVKWYDTEFHRAIHTKEMTKYFEDQWAVPVNQAGNESARRHNAAIKSNLDALAEKALVKNGK